MNIRKAILSLATFNVLAGFALLLVRTALWPAPGELGPQLRQSLVDVAAAPSRSIDEAVIAKDLLREALRAEIAARHREAVLGYAALAVIAVDALAGWAIVLFLTRADPRRGFPVIPEPGSSPPTPPEARQDK